MKGKIYLVLFVILVALAATGVYLRQHAKAAAEANCETPAPAPPPATPPPKLPGFAIDAACGTGAEAPKAPKATQAPAKPKGK